LWSKSGDQGNSWKNYTVNLSSLSGTGKLRFRVVTNSWRSDVALDDIVITGAKKGEESIVNLEETPNSPVSYFLFENYPNPFNPVTTIKYAISQAANVSLKVYNIKGQLVKTLVNENKETGNHSVVWNGKDNNEKPVSSGVYFYRIKAGKFIEMKKMILLK